MQPTWDSAAGGVWVDESSASPQQANGNQLGAEAVTAATHFSNRTQASNRNTQYVIVSPTGTHPDGFNSLGSDFCACATTSATARGQAVP